MKRKKITKPEEIPDNKVTLFEAFKDTERGEKFYERMADDSRKEYKMENLSQEASWLLLRFTYFCMDQETKALHPYIQPFLSEFKYKDIRLRRCFEELSKRKYIKFVDDGTEMTFVMLVKPHQKLAKFWVDFYAINKPRRGWL